MPPKKKIRSNQLQLRMLVDHMSVNRHFANGEFTGPMGNQQHQQEWEELRTMLKNYGPDKTIDQWRHTWRDLKKKAREEGAQLRKARAQTGNFRPVPTLSEMTTKILGVTGSEMAFGIENSVETGIGHFLVQQPPTIRSEADRRNLSMTTGIGSLMEPPISCSSQARPRQGELTSLPLHPRSIPPIRPPTPQQRRQDLRDQASEYLAVEQQNLIEEWDSSMEPQDTLVVPLQLPQPAPAPFPHLSAPTVPLSTDTPQQRRKGLGNRAAEFLEAEHETTNVLKDILNTLKTQNQILLERNKTLALQARMKNRERIRQARQKKY